LANGTQLMAVCTQFWAVFNHFWEFVTGIQLLAVCTQLLAVCTQLLAVCNGKALIRFKIIKFQAVKMGNAFANSHHLYFSNCGVLLMCLMFFN